MGMAAKICVGALLGFLSLSAAASASDASHQYVILKEGEQIGAETVSVSNAGARTEVNIHTKTHTKVLFLEFKYEQNRTEIWQNDQIVEVRSKTLDDGKPFELSGARTEQGWVLNVNGAQKNSPFNSMPLSLWNAEVLKFNSTFGTIDGASYNVKIEDLGQAVVVIDGSNQQARHYRMSGDMERDLWYGQDGVLLRAAFKRAGYPIEFVKTASGRGG